MRQRVSYPLKKVLLSAAGPGRLRWLGLWLPKMTLDWQELKCEMQPLQDPLGMGACPGYCPGPDNGEMDRSAGPARARRSCDDQPWSETAGTICPRCKMPVGASARFCLECGATLRRVKRCVCRGMVLRLGDGYCDECDQQQY